jgi:hypothetical protein
VIRPASGGRHRYLAVMAIAALLVTASSSAPPVRAADTTIQITAPDKGPAAVGDTYTVTVTQDAAVPTSGAQVSLAFNPLALQVKSVALGAAYARAPIFVGASAEAIKAANASGSLGPVAAAFIPPEAVPAGPADFLVITFRVVGCGRSVLGLASGATGAALLDGLAASYGTPLEVAASPADVIIPCAPGESPVPTPAPSSSAGAGASGSTLTAGTCPIWLQTRANSTVGAILDAATPGFESAWAPQTAMLVGTRTTTQALSELTNGDAQVAAIDRPLYPEEVAGLLAWQVGTDATGHPVFVAVRKPGVANRIDNSPLVRGDDLVNYLLSAPGQAAVAQAGYQAVGIPAAPPVLDYDINLDGGVSVLDLGAITGRWGQTSACRGWIRADANNDGGVSVLDLGQVTGHWGHVGFVTPDPPAPWADAFSGPMWGFVDTRPNGDDATYFLSMSGYNAFDDNNNVTPLQALAYAQGDTVWSAFGHANGGQIAIENGATGGPPAASIGAVVATHGVDVSPDFSLGPTAYLIDLPEDWLDDLKLMAFVGCHTGNDAAADDLDGNLVRAATEHLGAQSAIGFTHDINWVPDAAGVWTDSFFHSLHLGRNVETSANDALNDVYFQLLFPWGFDNPYIVGGNTTIVPIP